MAVLDSVDIDSPARDAVRYAFWTWFQKNQEEVLFSFRILFYKYEKRVKDLRPWVERFFGPEVFA